MKTIDFIKWFLPKSIQEKQYGVFGVLNQAIHEEPFNPHMADLALQFETMYLQTLAQCDPDKLLQMAKDGEINMSVESAQSHIDLWRTLEETLSKLREKLNEND